MCGEVGLWGVCDVCVGVWVCVCVRGVSGDVNLCCVVFSKAGT